MSDSLDKAGSAGIFLANEGEGLANLLELSPDPLFKEGLQPGGKPAMATPGNLSPALATLTRLDLDITRISNRLLVMGRTWTHGTDRSSHRNNIGELAQFLNAR